MSSPASRHSSIRNDPTAGANVAEIYVVHEPATPYLCASHKPGAVAFTLTTLDLSFELVGIERLVIGFNSSRRTREQQEILIR